MLKSTNISPTNNNNRYSGYICESLQLLKSESTYISPNREIKSYTPNTLSILAEGLALNQR